MLKKTLIALILLLQIPAIMLLWLNSSGHLLAESTGFKLVALGRVAGLLAVFFTLLQLVLLSRPRWLESSFGLDRLTRIHHLNGFTALMFIFIHPVLLVTGYSANNKISMLNQFMSFLGMEDVIKAVIGVGVFAAIVFLSIYKIRNKLPYELWYGLHLLAYLAVLLAWGHQLEIGADFFNNRILVLYWYGLYSITVLLVTARFLRPILQWQRFRFRVAKVVRESTVAKSVYITGKSLADFRIDPGQFMIFRFLDRNRWWQAHPFSLSQAMKANSFRITIKNSGDFSGKIDTLEPGTPVIIDGPYGVFTLKRAEGEKLFFIAGGAGITPVKSIIDEAVESNKDIILLYFSRTAKEAIFKDELDRLAKRKSVKVHHVFTREANSRGVRGRLNDAMIVRFAPDIKSRDIFLCGPRGLLKTARAILEKMGVNKDRVHYEEFAL